MTDFTIDSRREPQQTNFTRLILHVPATDWRQARMTFRYFDGSTLQAVFSAAIHRLFQIRFRQYDLKTGRMYWGYYEYSPAARLPEVIPGDGILTLKFNDVPGRVDTNDPRPEDVPSSIQNLPTPPALDPIDVTVTIKAEADPLSHGWIHVDINHGYPRQVHERSADFAWEQTVRYPVFAFDEALAKQFQTPIVGPLLKFSSVYLSSGSALTGIAFHAEDVNGQATFAEYDKDKFQFVQVLRNSMHLLGKDFVRPPKYFLSGGDIFGFGGNRVSLRLRAFRKTSVCAGATVGWYDVAEIYRSWLRTRYAAPTETFYRKFREVDPNPFRAPVDTMSPYTIVNNWGLDGAVEPGHALSAVLEMHPARKQDENRSENRTSFATIADTILSKFSNRSQVRLEIQTWGIEMAGFYQFICGFPHLSDVMHGDGAFHTGVRELAAYGVATTVTTDPLNTLFNRTRFKGHLRLKDGVQWTDANLQNFKNWRALIDAPFPQAVIAKTCAVTKKTIGTKVFDRIWSVDEIAASDPQSIAARLNRGQKRDEWGRLMEHSPLLADGLLRAAQKQICPTADVARLYLEDWVKPRLFDKDVRIVEFMKHGPFRQFCFRPGHRHILADDPDHTDTRYDDAIGVGAWYVRRVKAIFHQLRMEGIRRFDSTPPCSFRMSHETEPPQALVPYVDQYYSGGELHAFLYSHLATPLMWPGRDWAGIHPGYREQKLPNAPDPSPTYMLHPDRDGDPILDHRTPEMTPDEVKALYEKRRGDFAKWRDTCVAYFQRNFRVVSWGVAPRAYPVRNATTDPLVPWNESAPLALTNPRTYTYNRCVQNTFNLRANIFFSGIGAVTGMRIMIPSSWLDTPTDYDAPAVEHAVRAAQLQMQHARFFRYGHMLGETGFVDLSGNPVYPKVLCAWLAGPRSFQDVKPLVDHIGADDPQLGNIWRSQPLRDFVSFAWDRQTEFVDVIKVFQIQHRVWEHVENGVRRILYAFANVGNTTVQVRFVYGRGLERPSSSGRWRRTISLDGGPPGTAMEVRLGQPESQLMMPPRSFAAVLVEP